MVVKTLPANNKRRETITQVALSEVNSFIPGEAEAALIGSMIMDGRVIPEVVSILKSSEVLFQARHVAIYEALVYLSGQGGDVDIVRLTEHLKASNQLESVGGVDYLIELSESVPSPVAAPYYAKTVLNARTNLQCYSDTLEAAKAMLSTPKDAKEIITQLEAKLISHRSMQAEDAPEPIGQITAREVERASNGGLGMGIPTGFPEVDKLTAGLFPGEVVIVAARPSVGKSAVAMSVAKTSARHGHGTLFFSVEMSKMMVAHRFLSYMTRINMVDIRSGNLDQQRKIDLQAASEELRSLPLYIDGQANTPSLIRARVRQELAKHPVRLVVIDYLQMLQSDAKKEGYGTRDNEVGTMSRAIKAMAREFDLAVVLLSQLNRGPESREGHKPRISDLRESGSIEQDADTVWLLHQDDYYNRHDPNYERSYIGEINVAKQRNGPTDIVRVDLCPHTGQWLDTSENYAARVMDTAFGDTGKASPRRYAGRNGTR